VQNKRIAGKLAGDFLKAREIKFGIALELVGAVAFSQPVRFTKSTA